MVSPYTIPALVLLGGSPFLPPEIVSGKAPQWEPILGAWTRDPFPPALGSASTQPCCLPWAVPAPSLAAWETRPLDLDPAPPARGRGHLEQRSQAPACTCSGQKLEQEMLRWPQCSSQHRGCSSSGLAHPPTLSVSLAGILVGREKPPQGWVCQHSAFREPGAYTTAYRQCECS